jgi:broad specificity phosphatase PhoE
LPQRFVLIRHGESEWNASGRWQGHGDPPLTAAGTRQAEALAHELRALEIDRLVSSDLRRAMQTAACLDRILGVKVEARVDLRELDVGSWTGLTRPEIELRDAELLASFETEDPSIRPGGGESRLELRRRVFAAIDELASFESSGITALVCHLGVIRVLRPGAEPANAEWIETTLDEIRSSAAHWGLGGRV